MKIRTIFTSIILSVFVIGSTYQAQAAAAPNRSFSRTFKSGHIPSASTTNVEEIIETDTGTVSPVTSRRAPSSGQTTGAATAAASGGGSSELGILGLTPKPWIKDRSMWKDPDGCTLIDGTPCTKPCGSKCMKPCDSGNCKKAAECRDCTPKCRDCTLKCRDCPLPVMEPACANYLTVMEDEIYQSIHYRCSDFAPVDFQYVDFRLQKGRKYGAYSDRMGKYRFRIFGCRREARDVLLNQGRVVEKDMHFIDVFQDVTNGCLPLVKIPDDLCINPNQPLPEYVLTAEITGFYMNVCDEYDWEKAKKENKRNGSAEITVVWRLMNLTKTQVLWKGTSQGFAELYDGEYNGELMLVEKAFADAANRLYQQPGFAKELSTRVHPQELAQQRQALIDMQRKLDPVKCQYHEVIKKAECDCSKCPKSQCTPDEELVWVDVQKSVEEEPLFVEEVEAKTVCEFGEISSTGVCPVGEVEEASDFWLEVKQTDEFSSFIDKGVMCINDREPYDAVTNEELLEIRNSLAVVANSNGARAGGLILSELYLLTSADIIVKNSNYYDVELAGGDKIKARAFRINTNKNTALLLLERQIKYTPLSISLDLPEIDEKTYFSIGLKAENRNNLDDFLSNRGVVTGYRYADGVGVEILTNTNTQQTTLGSSLINTGGTHFGFNHSKQKQPDGPDLFLPMETALQSLGLEICEREYTVKRPKYTPVSDAIKADTGNKAPEAMDKKEIK